MSTLREHLQSFVPDMSAYEETAARAVILADEGKWLSTLKVHPDSDSVLSVAAIVEELRLDPFLDHSDPWAPVLSE